RLYTCGVRAQFYSALTNPCTRFVNNIVYVATGVFGAISVISGAAGAMSVGQIATFLSYANQYTKPFNEITGVITELQAAFASARRVFAVLDEIEEIPEKEPPAPAVADGTLKIEDVSFSYKPEQKLLENVNLDVKAGQRIAIVGPTGCGKTTLINLLMRFYDVREGAIKVGGSDIRDMKRDELRALFGMVLQDTWIFTGTIRENIAYGKPDATEEEIVAAAKMSHCHSFIRRLPQGYDTVVSEDGGTLSQGQKQLLCISRIMLTNPPMLILDEATSSIDTRTELKIQSAFAKLMKGKTSFIIAHRLSTIRDADVILVMKDGNIIEQGNHETLLGKGGFYANLYNSQFEN
ncbi:MAG: ABC transporter ATP-binding protein, partial [Oscillospiraceae bacterium]|nr:ABC transporter ATP-binding protein [Oscillospiraceae bacterium]